MPVYKTITVDPGTKVLIWKIEEPYEQLLENLILTDNCTRRVNGMKSDIHRRGFLSVRHLLQAFGYTAHDLYYDAEGKPHLTDGSFISITHSFQFASVVISTKNVGIDIEMQRNKIIRIADKFTTVDDYSTITNTNLLVAKLTKVWCAKEALYKMYATPGLSFLQHIYIADFEPDALTTTGVITYNGKTSMYTITFLTFEGFTCAYAQPE